MIWERKSSAGPTLDGLGSYYREAVEESMTEPVDIAVALRTAEVDVLVNYLPVGSEEAARFYAEAALQAGVGFVNCIPVFIASDRSWADRFQPLGSRSSVTTSSRRLGATIVHRALARLFEERGVDLERTMQLNVGGNMDFKNMLEKDRLESKRISKTQAVTSQIPYDLGDGNVHIGPSDFVSWLSDRKWAYLRLEGRSFGDVPLNLELKLEVWDSPNSAGVVIDAIRAIKTRPGPRNRRTASGPFRLLHEKPAGAIPRRESAGFRVGFHCRRKVRGVPHRGLPQRSTGQPADQPVDGRPKQDRSHQGPAGDRGADHPTYRPAQRRGCCQRTLRGSQAAGGQGDEQRQGKDLQEPPDDPLRNRPAASQEDHPAPKGDGGDHQDQGQVIHGSPSRPRLPRWPLR